MCVFIHFSLTCDRILSSWLQPPHALSHLSLEGLRKAFYHSARRYGCTTSHRTAAAPKLTKTQNSPRGLLPPLTPVDMLQNGCTKPYGGTSPR